VIVQFWRAVRCKLIAIVLAGVFERMTFLILKMLFRKGETASAILAVALLVATPASISPTVNHINSQTEALGGYVSARASSRLSN